MSAAALRPLPTSSVSSAISSSWKGRARRAKETAPLRPSGAATPKGSASAQPASCVGLLGRAAGGRRAGGGLERGAQVLGRVLGQAARLGAAQAQVAGVGVDASIEPRSMMSTQRVEVELGGEGVAHAAHGRLQPAALADRELQAALGLLDAGVAIAGQQHEQRGEREDEQHGGRVAAGGEAREEADRRQAGVDHHDVREHLELQLRRDPARRRFAQRGGAGVEDAAAQQRGAQQRKVREVELRRAGEDEHERRPERVPCVGDREEQSQRGAAAAHEVREPRARTRPMATSSGTVAGGSSTSIGTRTSWEGTT